MPEMPNSDRTPGAERNRPRGQGFALPKGDMRGLRSSVPNPSGREVNVARQVQELQRDMEVLARHVAVPTTLRDPSAGNAIRDQMWKCKCCNSLLAYYNPDDDLMRVKYKDLMLFARAGGARPESILSSIMAACELHQIEMTEDFLETATQRVLDSADYGFLQVICRGCGQINTQEYAPDTSSGSGGDG